MKNPWQAVLGRERLWVVFWLYCVLGSVGLLVFLAVFNLSLEVALIVYVLWAHYSLWTCAFNTNWRPFGHAARIYACVIVAAVTASMLVTVKQGLVAAELEHLQ
jgi:hypothetical protein